jgi:hypothetical protein
LKKEILLKENKNFIDNKEKKNSKELLAYNRFIEKEKNNTNRGVN